ncbi:MAG: hypothetical protein GF403_01810 [Candidatus Coatesbacteria bacterium]|nr:hypothetical protein [Candidatus Coatesbacteria bacterium]
MQHQLGGVGVLPALDHPVVDDRHLVPGGADPPHGHIAPDRDLGVDARHGAVEDGSRGRPEGLQREAQLGVLVFAAKPKVAFEHVENRRVALVLIVVAPGIGPSDIIPPGEGVGLGIEVDHLVGHED